MFLEVPLMGKSIVIRVCPECEKAFYAAEVLPPLSCPFCACFFENKRRDKRIGCEAGLTFRFMDRSRPGRLKDYSENGLRMLYAGKMLKAGSVVEVELGAENTSECAVAVWSRRLSPTVFSSGLKRLGQRQQAPCAL